MHDEQKRFAIRRHHWMMALKCPPMLPALLMLLAAVPASNSFSGAFFSGEGDAEYLGLLDLGRRQYSSFEYEYQSVNMLYKGTLDGLLEGPTWGAWWTQNSYGTTMTSLPFMDDVAWHGTQHSMAWWFDSIGDGKKIDGTFHTTRASWVATDGSPVASPGPDVPAPDGALCDAAVPCGPAKDCCAYKQGDGTVPRHDWTFEETLSGVVMAAEQILVAHNKSAAAHYLPLFLRTSATLEHRRDPVTKAFLTGVGSNLLAPSFGGGPNGTMSRMTGIVVTYTAALDRMIQCAKLVGDPAIATLLDGRRAENLVGLQSMLSPSGEYFVRSVDADGTRHGVVGQRPRHGYFEASPNHDAVALRVVDDELSEKIMGTIDRLGPLLRPNVFILPNTDAQGKPSVPGSGAVGYDDMLCGSGAECHGEPTCWCNGTKGSIWTFGTWVNGGIWTTTEARAIMAYYRTGRTAAVAASMKQMTTLYTKQWKLDNPLVKFGLGTYQNHPTMVTIDAFGAHTAGIRGLFEYLYAADTLLLLPHLPDSITALTQHFGVRWGSYRLHLSTVGLRSSGIASVEVNGKPLAAPHTMNSTAVTLSFGGLPALSKAAAAAVDSDVLTVADNVTIKISFKQQHSAVEARQPAVSPQLRSPPVPLAAPLNCSAAAGGLTPAELAAVAAFLAAAAAKGLAASVVGALGQSALDFSAGHAARCSGLNSGSLPSLRDPAGNSASLTDMLTASASLFAGMTNLLTEYTHYTDPAAIQLVKLWENGLAPGPAPPSGGSCKVPGAQKKRCGLLLDKQKCEANGCCFDNDGPLEVHCFHPAMPNA